MGSASAVLCRLMCTHASVSRSCGTSGALRSAVAHHLQSFLGISAGVRQQKCQIVEGRRIVR